MRRWLRAASVAVVLAHAAPALAQGAADPLFEEGRVLMAKKDFAGACAKFKQSYDTAPSAGRAFNLSACEEQQAHLVQAVAWLDAGIGQLGPDDARAKAATVKRGEIVVRMPKLTVRLASGAPASATVEVNGRPIPIGVRTPVDPGANVVTVKSDKHADGVTKITLAAEELRELDVSVGALLPDAPTPPPSEPPAVGPRRPGAPAEAVEVSDTQRVAGWVTAGAGAAITVGAIVTGSIMLAENGAYHDCPTGTGGEDRCANAEDARALGAALEIPNAILWGVGLAGVGTGIIVVLTAPSAPEPGDVAWAVVPAVGPGFTGVSVHGAF